jgi:hypothetical protein
MFACCIELCISRVLIMDGNGYDSLGRFAFMWIIQESMYAGRIEHQRNHFEIHVSLNDITHAG